jgi:hypothetical protein
MNRAIILLSKYRALLPYIVAQAKHETNDFTSKVYKENQNLFGMKWTEGRRGQVASKGLQSPEGNHYAKYLTDSTSIIDLLIWFDVKKFPLSVLSVNEYAQALKDRGYFTDGLSNYISGLKRWM